MQLKVSAAGIKGGVFTAGASTSQSSCKNMASKKLGEDNKTSDVVQICRLKTRIRNLRDLALASLAARLLISDIIISFKVQVSIKFRTGPSCLTNV